MAIYLSSLSGFVIPFGNLIVPIVLWVMKRKEHPFINQHGKEVVNFQISLTICFVVLLVLAIMLAMVFPPLAMLAWLGGIIIGLGAIIYIIIGAINVSEGKDFQFPYNIRFMK